MDSTTLTLRNKFSAQVALHMQRYSLARGLLVAGAHIASCFVAIGLREVLFPEGIFALVLVVFWIGTRMRALGNILHECAHSSYFENNKANDVFGTLLGCLDFRSFRAYRREHMQHHRWLGVEGKDPDFLGHGFSALKYVYGLMPRPISECDSLALNSFRLLTMVGAIVVSVTLLPAIALYYWLPYFSSYLFCRVLSDFMDHGFLANKAQEFERSRNHFFSSKVLNWIFFPRNDGFHLIHHIFPSAPVRSYEQLHTEMMSAPEYSARN